MSSTISDSGPESPRPKGDIGISKSSSVAAPEEKVRHLSVVFSVTFKFPSGSPSPISALGVDS